VVYGQFDTKIRFENESDVRFDSRFDSNEKNDSQVPSVNSPTDSQPQTCGAVPSSSRAPGMVRAYKFCMWYSVGLGAKLRFWGLNPQAHPCRTSDLWFVYNLDYRMLKVFYVSCCSETLAVK